MSGVLYELHGVRRVFKQGDRLVEALVGIDLRVAQGEFLAIEGASGSGKTTLLQLLGGLDRPSAGRVGYDGADLGALGDRELTDLRLRSFGYVFQQFNLIPTLTALENVEAALAPRGVGSAELRHRSEALLSEVGLADRGDHLPGQLSGGEQQRVAIARALVGEPKVVIADEPTGTVRRSGSPPSSSRRTPPSSPAARRGGSRGATARSSRTSREGGLTRVRPRAWRARGTAAEMTGSRRGRSPGRSSRASAAAPAPRDDRSWRGSRRRSGRRGSPCTAGRGRATAPSRAGGSPTTGP